MKLNNQKGFTLIELLVVIAIIGILSSVAVPQYTAYKNRAYDTASQSDLRNLYMACQDYWMFNGGTSSCTLANITSNGYGFVPSTDVNITIDNSVNNTEFDFVATAQHVSSINTFTVDYMGAIRGCSGQAQNGGGGNAGGCGNAGNGGNPGGGNPGGGNPGGGNPGGGNPGGGNPGGGNPGGGNPGGGNGP